MKKLLLSAVTLFAAISVNAQEVGQIDPDGLGITSDDVSVAGGTVLAQMTSVTMYCGADDTYKCPSSTGGGISKISFDDNVVDGTVGIQGNTNPKDIDGGTPSTTLIQPASGAFFTFDVAADGYLYVVGKISSNKSYTVFEEGTCIGYTLAFADNSGSFDAVNFITIDNDAEDDGVPYVTTANTYYNSNGGILWPERILGECTSETDLSSWTTIGKSGMGYIVFPVYEDCEYRVNANGSKLTCSGFYFSTTEATSIVGLDADGNDYVTFVGGSSTGINSVAVAADVDATSSKAVKTVENGKIVITKDGKKYNVAGAQIQ